MPLYKCKNKMVDSEVKWERVTLFECSDSDLKCGWMRCPSENREFKIQ